MTAERSTGVPPTVNVNVEVLIVLPFISSLNVALTNVLTNAVSELCGGDTAVMAAGEGGGTGDGETKLSDDPQLQPSWTKLIKPSVIADRIVIQRFLSDERESAMGNSFGRDNATNCAILIRKRLF